MERTQHNFGLDVVRAGAILLVLFSHVPTWFLPGTRQTEIDAAYIGSAGVELFFSLSGFLIGGLLLRTSEAGLGPAGLGRFWSRRWLRTLPAYWALLLLLSWYYGRLDWRSLSFLQNFVPRRSWTPLTPHTWSLVLEEWFYLFVPCLLAAAGAVLGRRRAGWGFPLVCLGLVAACTAGRFVAGLQPSATWGADPSINPILRLDCAAWGVLAAWAVRYRTIPAWFAAILTAAGGACLVLIGSVWVKFFDPAPLLRWGFDWWGTAWLPMQPAMMEASAAMLVLGLHRLLSRGWPGLSMPIGTLASLSYALYLVHVPVISLAHTAGLQDNAGWRDRIAITLLVATAALLLRWLVEKPVLWLRDCLTPDRLPIPGFPARRLGRPGVEATFSTNRDA